MLKQYNMIERRIPFTHFPPQTSDSPWLAVSSHHCAVWHWLSNASCDGTLTRFASGCKAPTLLPSSIRCRRVDSQWPWLTADLVVCSTNSLPLSKIALIRGCHNGQNVRLFGLVMGLLASVVIFSLQPSILHDRLTFRVSVLCARARFAHYCPAKRTGSLPKSEALGAVPAVASASCRQQAISPPLPGQVNRTKRQNGQEKNTMNAPTAHLPCTAQ